MKTNIWVYKIDIFVDITEDWLIMDIIVWGKKLLTIICYPIAKLEISDIPLLFLEQNSVLQKAEAFEHLQIMSEDV